MEPQLKKTIKQAESLYKKTKVHQLVFIGNKSYGESDSFIILSVDELSLYPSRVSIYDTIYKEINSIKRKKTIIDTILKLGFSTSINIDDLLVFNYEVNFTLTSGTRIVNLRLQPNFNTKINFFGDGYMVGSYSGFFDKSKILKKLSELNDSTMKKIIRDNIIESIIN